MQLTGQAAAVATAEAAASSAEGKAPMQEAATMEYEPATETTCLD